ncbi:MAG: hypothetical protein VW397_06425 [Candidatus Margulisiibacteriota bacterium]
MFHISTATSNNASEKIQASFRAYRARKKIEFIKALNHWVNTGPNHETADRKTSAEKIKSVHKNHDYHLHIHKKNISSLPDVFDHLPHLVEAHITETNIKELPDSFFKLTNLTSLGLAENKLTELPKKIEELKKLCFLCLDKNNLTDLPSKELINLHELKDLRCIKNIILTIDQRLIAKYGHISFRENLDSMSLSSHRFNYEQLPKLTMEHLTAAATYLKTKTDTQLIDYLRKKQIGEPPNQLGILQVLIERHIKTR